MPLCYGIVGASQHRKPTFSRDLKYSMKQRKCFIVYFAAVSILIYLHKWFSPVITWCIHSELNWTDLNYITFSKDPRTDIDQIFIRHKSVGLLLIWWSLLSEFKFKTRAQGFVVTSGKCDFIDHDIYGVVISVSIIWGHLSQNTNSLSKRSITKWASVLQQLAHLSNQKCC